MAWLASMPSASYKLRKPPFLFVRQPSSLSFLLPNTLNSSPIPEFRLAKRQSSAHAPQRLVPVFSSLSVPPLHPVCRISSGTNDQRNPSRGTTKKSDSFRNSLSRCVILGTRNDPMFLSPFAPLPRGPRVNAYKDESEALKPVGIKFKIGRGRRVRAALNSRYTS